MANLAEQYGHTMTCPGTRVLSWMYSTGCPSEPPPPSHAATVALRYLTGILAASSCALLLCLLGMRPAASAYSARPRGALIFTSSSNGTFGTLGMYSSSLGITAFCGRRRLAGGVEEAG